MRDEPSDHVPPAEEAFVPPGHGAEKRIPSLRALFTHLREDWTANDRSIFRPGFQAMAVYRFGVWREGISPRILRLPFSFLYKAMYIFVRNVYGIELPYTAIIGRRLRVGHQHGIIVHRTAIIGDDCMIRQGVSIGISRVAKGRGKRVAPTLGDRVEVGAGTLIAGAVTIGDDAAIGANIVVMTNVPANSIVASPLPRIIPRPTGVTGSERLSLQ